MLREFVRLLFCPKGKVMYWGAKGHRVEFEDRFINRYYEPLEKKAVEEQNKKTNNLFFEYDYVESPLRYHPKRNLFFLYPFLNGYKLLYAPVKLSEEIKKWQRFEEMSADYTKAVDIPLDDYAKQINEVAEYIDFNRALIELLLRLVKPRLVYILCYYVPAGYALSLACRKLDIRLVEMQHGGQGNIHPAYAGWNNCPPMGYNILPREFWCWDESSAGAIRAWTKKQQYHSVFVGGNTWIEYLKDYPFPAKTNEKIILYTMQEHHLDDFVLDAIAQTHKDYVWWLRFHPRKQDARSTVTKQLKKLDLFGKVNIEEANLIPLPLILKNTTIHISKFSGSVLEAKLMGVKTIIIDPVGKQFFEKDIDNKLVFYFDKDGETPLVTFISLASQN